MYINIECFTHTDSLENAVQLCKKYSKSFHLIIVFTWRRFVSKRCKLWWCSVQDSVWL